LKTVQNGPRSTDSGGNSNVLTMKPPSRKGKEGERKILKEMLYALEHRVIPKPSGTELRKYAGRRVGVPKGSKSTVLKAQEIGREKGWCCKPEGGQWKWNDTHEGTNDEERLGSDMG